MEFPDFRKDFTQYQIEVNRDSKGYYFSVFRLYWLPNNDFKAKEYLTESHTPHKTREDAYNAGKQWLHHYRQGETQ